MTIENVNIRSQHIDIPQDHNETSCANEVKSCFADAYRKICTKESMLNFIICSASAALGMSIGVMLSQRSIDATYDKTLNITMKKIEYRDNLADSSKQAAIIAAVSTGLIVWLFSLMLDGKQTDATNNRENSR
jgi:hypothetical protein